GADGSATWPGGDHTWTTTNATQAEIDTYVFLHEIQDWGLRVDPSNPMGSRFLRSTVNIDATCNAYFDGSVNFFRAGRGCNNTGRIADVNYHEWGHGFHYFGIAPEIRDFSFD